MANSRTSLLLAVVLCACGVAFSKEDAYQQLDAKIQTSVETAVKQQLESGLNTQISKLIDERLPATVTPQVEDTFNKHQSKIVDEILKIINSQEGDDDSSGAVDAERLAAAESAATGAQKQVKDLLARIDSLEATLATERASTEKFTTSARDRINKVSSMLTDVQEDQRKHKAAIAKNTEADEKLKKQGSQASTGGVTQEQVQATVSSEFDVLKKMSDASEKTIHQLQLKIGEVKTILENPTNGVQEKVQDLSQRVKRFQGELDDVRENVVRQQFKENRDMVNKNKDAIDKAAAKLTKQQKKLDTNVEEDGKLKAAYEKEKKRLSDLVAAVAKRLTQLEAEMNKGGFEKYMTMTKDWISAQNQRFYTDVYVEHIKNFDSEKVGKALLANTQAFADWSFKSGGSLVKYLAAKFAELTESTRNFLAKDFEPRARKFLKSAYTTSADLINKALENAGPAIQEAQKLAVVYYKEGVQLYNKVHKDAVQQFIDMKLAKDKAVLAATVALVSVLALIASISLFVVYKIVAGFFSCLFGACCGRSSDKKTKKSKKREEAGGATDESKSPSKNASGSSRKKKAKKGTRGKYDTL